MLEQRIGNISLRSGAQATGSGLGLALAIWLVTGLPANALENTAQVLAGGQTTAGAVAPGNIRFTAPGTFFNNQVDFPRPGWGERAVQLLLPAGQLKRLRVRFSTETNPTAGSFVLMVRVRGADTALTCTVTAAQLTGFANCGSNATVALPNASNPIAIRTTNTLENAGTGVYTYTLVYD